MGSESNFIDRNARVPLTWVHRSAFARFGIDDVCMGGAVAGCDRCPATCLRTDLTLVGCLGDGVEMIHREAGKLAQPSWHPARPARAVAST